MALFCLLALVLSSKLNAHEWFNYTQDPVTQDKCCGGDDCAAVNPEWVTETEFGYLLQMTLEQSRTVNKTSKLPVYAIIPWSRVQSPPNSDHSFYACIWEQNREPKSGNGVICFFASPSM